MNETTREAWLLDALHWASSNIFGCGQVPDLPKNIRVSCGWPSSGGLRKKKRVIGECWAMECSEKKYSEIFISPTLNVGPDAVETLLHEAVHATVGVDQKHKGDFIKVAREIGFNKPWTSTPPSEELRSKIGQYCLDVEPYPHSRLDSLIKAKGPTEPQKNKHLKLQCPNCLYVIRVTQKHLDVGIPTCCCGGLFELEIKE
jgi:hypothetical protein